MLQGSTGEGSTCSKDLAYDARTRVKQYTCQVTDESLVRVVGPVIGFGCSTVAPDSKANSTVSKAQSALSSECCTNVYALSHHCKGAA